MSSWKSTSRKRRKSDKTSGRNDAIVSQDALITLIISTCRQIGSDITEGETILQAGVCLGPAEIGLLATMGITQVECYGKPVVGVMSTGNEVGEPSESSCKLDTCTGSHLFGSLQLVEPERKPRAGQIRDANRTTLSTLVADAGFEAVDLGIAADTFVNLLKFSSVLKY